MGKTQPKAVGFIVCEEDEIIKKDKTDQNSWEPE